MIRHELIVEDPENVGRVYTWDLTRGTYVYTNAAGAQLRAGRGPIVAPGIEGMGDMEYDVFARSTPRGAGRVRTGTRGLAREAFLPLVFEELGNEYVETQRLFFSLLSPDYPVRWRVHSGDYGWRELVVYLKGGDQAYERDPSQIRQVVGLAFDADQPYWQGETQTAMTATDGDGTPFFGVNNSAPPFHIQPGAQNGVNWLGVEGDIEAWPVLTVYGPCSGFLAQKSSGSYGRVSGGFQIPSGQKLVIDFDPTVQAAMLMPVSATTGGQNVTKQLTDRDFFRIEKTLGTGSLVTLTMIGDGSARLDYTPKFRRAF